MKASHRNFIRGQRPYGPSVATNVNPSDTHHVIGACARAGSSPVQAAIAAAAAAIAAVMKA